MSYRMGHQPSTDPQSASAHHGPRVRYRIGGPQQRTKQVTAFVNSANGNRPWCFDPRPAAAAHEDQPQ
jgi:hypothetical protein